jgi:hypothetical protein
MLVRLHGVDGNLRPTKIEKIFRLPVDLRNIQTWFEGTISRLHRADWDSYPWICSPQLDNLHRSPDLHNTQSGPKSAYYPSVHRPSYGSVRKIRSNRSVWLVAGVVQSSLSSSRKSSIFVPNRKVSRCGVHVSQIKAAVKLRSNVRIGSACQHVIPDKSFIGISACNSKELNGYHFKRQILIHGNYPIGYEQPVLVLKIAGKTVNCACLRLQQPSNTIFHSRDWYGE